MDEPRNVRNRPEQFRFADSSEIGKRKDAFERLVICVFEPDLRPLFVSDEATIFDISGDSTQEILERIRIAYGIVLTHEQLRQPMWMLLDLLERKA